MSNLTQDLPVIDIHLENEQYVQLILKYLSILQEGRIKPNSKATGNNDATVRDSIDNLNDINACKDRLNVVFGIPKVTRTRS